MSDSSIVRIGSFVARDGDGKDYQIGIYEKRHRTSERDGGIGYSGGKLLKTSDGRKVHYVSQGNYELESLPENIPLTSDDPNAP